MVHVPKWNHNLYNPYCYSTCYYMALSLSKVLLAFNKTSVMINELQKPEAVGMESCHLCSTKSVLNDIGYITESLISHNCAYSC